MTPRSYLFLQGPQSRFFERVGRALSERGHRVCRVNLNLGDRLFWRLPAVDFRGSPEEWPDFVARLLAARGVTDLLLHGDRRPYHRAAAAAARPYGIAVSVTDLGYLRPDWLTLERDGMTRGSHFPRDPRAIFELADAFPEPDLAPRFTTSIARLAVNDIAYNLAMASGRARYPHYRHHALQHPFVEYLSRVREAPRRAGRWPAATAAKAELARQTGAYFLFPLQLAGDFQLRDNSPFRAAADALRLVLASFAASGTIRRLAVVAHPLDEGLTDWRGVVRQAGLGARVAFFNGGISAPLLAGAAGVVTVNSTVGLTALRRGIPVKPLGSAIYDVPGMVHAGDLAGFWGDPQRPDPSLVAAFVRALAGATQVKGGYYTKAGQAHALPVFVERLERGLYPLPRRSMLSCARTPETV